MTGDAFGILTSGPDGPRPERRRGESPFTLAELESAGRWLLRHRSAAGFDGIAPGDHRADCPAFRTVLRRTFDFLDRGEFEFYPSRVGRTRRGGKTRRHMIANFDCAIVGRACVVKARPAWDRMRPSVLGGRPGFDRARDVLGPISQYLAEGTGWVLRFDIRHAFADAEFGDAADCLERLLPEHPGVIALIRRWRTAEREARVPGLGEGSPFGTILLAALMSDRVVPALEPHLDLLATWVDDGCGFVRDENRIRAAERELHRALGSCGLRANMEKTAVAPFDPKSDELSSWSFLGYSWRGCLPAPSLKRQEKLLARLTRLAMRGDVERLRTAINSWGLERARETSLDLDVLNALDRQIFGRLGWLGRLPRLTQIALRASATDDPGRTKTNKKSGESSSGEYDETSP